MEGAKKVSATDQGVGKRGRGYLDLGKDLHRSGPGSLDVWVRDVDDETVHWEVLGGIPAQGGPQDDGTATADGG